MHIHHMIPFAEADRAERIDPALLVLLCSKCHRWVHSKKNAAGEYFVGREEGQ